MARSQGARPLFVEVTASREVVRQRLLKREAEGKSISDGRLELYDRQAASWESLSAEIQRHALLVDGGAPLEEKLEAVTQRLEETGHAN
jgi:predicted kinase